MDSDAATGHILGRRELLRPRQQEAGREELAPLPSSCLLPSSREPLAEEMRLAEPGPASPGRVQDAGFGARRWELSNWHVSEVNCFFSLRKHPFLFSSSPAPIWTL